MGRACGLAVVYGDEIRAHDGGRDGADGDAYDLDRLRGGIHNGNIDGLRSLAERPIGKDFACGGGHARSGSRRSSTKRRKASNNVFALFGNVR